MATTQGRQIDHEGKHDNSVFTCTVSNDLQSLVARLIDPGLFTYPPSYFPGPVLAAIAPTTVYPSLQPRGHLKLELIHRWSPQMTFSSSYAPIYTSFHVCCIRFSALVFLFDLS
jgi:hypothetical protein